MNNETHTPEPWGVMPTSVIDGLIIVAPDGNPIAHLLFGSSKDEAEKRANARRIVAAVNACAGLSTEALEDGGQPMIKTSKLRRERDELTEIVRALSEVVRALLAGRETMDGRLLVDENSPLIDAARAALAKLK